MLVAEMGFSIGAAVFAKPVESGVGHAAALSAVISRALLTPPRPSAECAPGVWSIKDCHRTSRHRDQHHGSSSTTRASAFARRCKEVIGARQLFITPVEIASARIAGATSTSSAPILAPYAHRSAPVGYA